MSRYNFRPNLTDHAHLHFLVRPFFNASDTDLALVYNKLSTFTHAQIEDNNRRILLKFTKKHHREAFNWGTLQYHRRPLGFVAVARMSSDPQLQAKDYEKIEHRFANLVSQYDSYIFDSRCVIIGPENPNVTITKKNIIYLAETEKDITPIFSNFICEFVTSVFVVLESKRFDKMNEDCDRMQLPTTLYEPEQIVSESDTRFLKKKCYGRSRKLLADLCLLSGLYNEALAYYSISLKTLRNVNDNLWIGSAIEGLVACSIMALLGDSIIDSRSNTLVIEKSNISANVPVDNSAAVEEEKRKTFFNIDEMVEKYNEAIQFYRKFNTGLVLLEAHFKLIRLLLREKRKIDISIVVQNLIMFTIPLHFTEMEKIDFALMLASIHDQINLKRKAAFYRRQVAVLYFKNNNQSKPVLTQASTLLNMIANTYRIDLKEKNEYKKLGPNNGWCTVQSRILLDMLLIAQRLNNHLDAVRLLCFILAEFSSYISNHDHEYLLNLLEEYSDEPEPLKNESNPERGANLIQPLPIIRDFSPKKLAQYLQPVKDVAQQGGTNPFIFSSLSTRTKGKEKEKIVWVCGEVAEVAMVVDNPLPAEIKVNKMTLLTEGSQFEPHPATLALPAESGSFPFMLLGTPTQPGELIIKGYQVEILSITNTVYLSQPITIEVTPALPILKLSCNLPQVPNTKFDRDNIQTLFTSANLYHGHSCTGKVVFENSGKVPITKMDITLKKPREKQLLFDENIVQNGLPLHPGDTLTLDVVIMPDESWMFCVNKDKLEVNVTIRYSCETDEQPNVYQRISSWLTHVNVMPSLDFSNFTFKEIERHATCCLICFDAVNMTSVPMSVTTDLKIENHDISDLICCQKDSSVQMIPKDKTNIHVHFPRLLLEPPKLKRKTLEDIYKAFICDSVSFTWRLSDTSYSGVTYIQDLKVTSNDLTILKPKHLKLDVTANKVSLKDGESLDAKECELVNLTIKLINIRDKNLENLVLNVNPYQECKRTPKEMKQLCLPSGCLYKGIKNLNSGETFEHTCGLLFMYYGNYKVDITCSFNEQFNMATARRSRGTIVSSGSISSSAGTSRAPLTPVKMNINAPLSPNAVDNKLKSHEPNFWGQTFSINVQS